MTLDSQLVEVLNQKRSLDFYGQSALILSLLCCNRVKAIQLFPMGQRNSNVLPKFRSLN